MPKNLSTGNYTQKPVGGDLQSPTQYGINDILTEIRQKSLTEKEKGTDFERLMKLWFLTDPRYANLQQVWLWEEFPARKDFGGKDLGIDLVARTETGDYWAIQCKCYAEDAHIDKGAVDSFLANASRTFLDPETFQGALKRFDNFSLRTFHKSKRIMVGELNKYLLGLRES